MSNRTEGVREAGYELGRSRPLTAEQKEMIERAVRLHLADKRAA